MEHYWAVSHGARLVEVVVRLAHVVDEVIEMLVGALNADELAC
jgi:hypothetical protein